MAEAAVERSRFFCHSCSSHFAMNSSDLKCPHCDSGFVEQLDSSNTSLNSSLSTDVDVEGTSSNGPTALDLLQGSFLNYMPNIGPDNNDPNAVSFFSINIRPHNEPSSGPSTSSEASNRQPGPHLRLRNTRRRGNPSNSSAASSSNSTENQQAMTQMPNLFLEGLLQSIINGADPNAVLGGSGGLFGNAAGGNAWGTFQLHSNPGDYAWGTNGLDDVITQLLGQLDNTGAPPATENAIKKLPVHKITKDQVAACKDCSICMESFAVEDKVKKLPCDHMFHISCIDNWLELHNTCPICRKNIENSEQRSCPRTSARNMSSTSGPSTSG